MVRVKLDQVEAGDLGAAQPGAGLPRVPGV